jgi:Ni/Fe-hydrogenase subunit HybB-like protein
MSSHSHAVPAPVGGNFLNAVTKTGLILIAVLIPISFFRFFYGLGAVTHLNNGYPFGIWMVVDVVIGSAFACGGFSVAMLVYIFNRGQYHPLVRPALLGSLFGYTLAGVSVIYDLGRWWNTWHIFWPSYMNFNSVMLEVALCISLYIVVMWIEFSPTFLEFFGMEEKRRKLNKVMFFVIALGTLLPMMHQSSLGTLLVVMGIQIHPLWNTTLQPLLYLLTAITMGYAVVLFESCLAASAYRRKIEMHLLTPLAKVMLGILIAYLVVRFGDLIYSGQLTQAFSFSLETVMFWLETICFVLPLFLIGSEARRRNPANLFLAGITLMVGGALLRINGFLVGYETGGAFKYFPSLWEILVTAAMFTIEVLGYIYITRRFPVLPREA